MWKNETVLKLLNDPKAARELVEALRENPKLREFEVTLSSGEKIQVSDVFGVDPT